MENILLFDGSCAHCSEVASKIGELSIPGLEAKSIRSPQVVELLQSAGLRSPTKPSILVVNGDHKQLLSGWRMRQRLASVVGWRRSRGITRLLVTEWRARLAKTTEEYSPTRRRVIGTLTAGAAAVAGSVAVPAAASADTKGSSGTEGLKPANADDVRRALATNQMSRAVQTWGPADREVYEIRDGKLKVLAFTHGSSDIMTFVGTVSASPSGQPIALSMGRSSSRQHAIRYYTVTGTALAEVGVAATGKVQATPASGAITAADRHSVSPDFDTECFLLCLGASVSDSCIFSCAACASGIVFSCVSCGICAGTAGVSCAYACR